MEVRLEVSVDPQNKGLVYDAISYETGLTRAQVCDPTAYGYDHHGPEFTGTDPGALTSLFEDTIQGRPLPIKFATARIGGVDTLFAIALFLHRDLATHPQMPGLVASVDLVHRRGLAMYGHIDLELAKFFRLLGALFPPTLSKQEQGDRLRLAVGWIYEYVANGILPHLGPPLALPKVLEVGSNGFVFAKIADELHEGWVELYREGHLRGFLITDEHNGRRRVLASRKSVFIDFNLSRAAGILNEMEESMGNPPEWVADELWLHSPPDGTSILVSHLLEVFLRV